jgi:hypothetical protein
MIDAFDDHVDRLQECAYKLLVKVAAVRALKRLRDLSRQQIVASEVRGLTRLFTTCDGYFAGLWLIPAGPEAADRDSRDKVISESGCDLPRGALEEPPRAPELDDRECYMRLSADPCPRRYLTPLTGLIRDTIDQARQLLFHSSVSVGKDGSEWKAGWFASVAQLWKEYRLLVMVAPATSVPVPMQS